MRGRGILSDKVIPSESELIPSRRGVGRIERDGVDEVAEQEIR